MDRKEGNERQNKENERQRARSALLRRRLQKPPDGLAHEFMGIGRTVMSIDYSDSIVRAK